MIPTAPHRCRKPSVHPSKSPAARQSARKSPRVRTLTCRKCAELVDRRDELIQDEQPGVSAQVTAMQDIDEGLAVHGAKGGVQIGRVAEATQVRIVNDKLLALHRSRKVSVQLMGAVASGTLTERALFEERKGRDVRVQG